MANNKSAIKVALADDHVLLRNALASLIDSFGDCSVIHQSGNGKELIAKISTGSMPDVVLLDLNMPKMTGLEFLAELRNDHELKSITVHILTTSGDEQDKKTAFDLNVAGYVLKPLRVNDFEEIFDVLNNYWQLNEKIKLA